MKLRKLSLLFAAIAFCSFSSSAQLLWKISGNGLSKPSFIIGTHHVAPSNMIDQIPGFNEAINQCDVVYGEIEKDGLTSTEAQQKMFASITAPADSTLSKVLKPATIAKIDSILQAGTAGMTNAAQLESQKPSFVSTQLALLTSMAVFPGFNPNEQLDVLIQTKAAELGKQTDGFETTEFQLNLIFNKPIREQAEAMERSILDYEKSKITAKALADAYRNQDIEALNEIITKEFNDDTTPYDEKLRNFQEMFTNRNADWTNKLSAIMPQKSVFVAVGSGHLPGKDGLLDLLRKAGYTVEPMK